MPTFGYECRSQNIKSQTEKIKIEKEKEKQENKWTDKDDREHLKDYVFPLKLSLRGMKVAKTERIGTFTKEKDKNDEYRPMKVTHFSK